MAGVGLSILLSEIVANNLNQFGRLGEQLSSKNSGLRASINSVGPRSTVPAQSPVHLLVESWTRTKAQGLGTRDRHCWLCVSGSSFLI